MGGDGGCADGCPACAAEKQLRRCDDARRRARLLERLGRIEAVSRHLKAELARS